MVSYVNTTASSYLQRKQWSQRSWGTCPRLLHYSRQSWDVIPEACSQSIVYTLALLWMKQWKKQYSLPWQLLGGGILMKSINLLLKWMWSGGRFSKINCRGRGFSHDWVIEILGNVLLFDHLSVQMSAYMSSQPSQTLEAFPGPLSIQTALSSSIPHSICRF